MKTWIWNVVLICGAAMLLSLPSMVNAKSNEQVIDGGEGPLDATHPAVHALGDIVVCVWTKERQIAHPSGGWVKNIRIAFSCNDGVNWQQYEWVSPETDAEQDFADVRIYNDMTIYPDMNYCRVVVVWQERSVEGGNWVIKVAERDNPGYTGLWTYHGMISETDCDNALPKVDTMSFASQGQQPAYTYWHFVWQKKYDTGTYGIQLMTNRRDSTDNWMTSPRTIVSPPSSSWNYQHPAVATNYIGNSLDSEVHIVYHAIEPMSVNRILSESGNVPSWGPVRFIRYYFTQIDSSQSPTLGVPDICSYGIGPNAVVDVVYYSGGFVIHQQSTNSGSSYNPLNPQILAMFCSNQFRSVAVYSDTYQNSYQISVVSSGGGILYFTKCINGNWITPQQWTTVGVNEYVDVCLPSPLTYSHVVWMRDQSAIYYARDP